MSSQNWIRLSELALLESKREIQLPLLLLARDAVLQHAKLLQEEEASDAECAALEITAEKIGKLLRQWSMDS